MNEHPAQISICCHAHVTHVRNCVSCTTNMREEYKANTSVPDIHQQYAAVVQYCTSLICLCYKRQRPVNCRGVRSGCQTAVCCLLAYRFSQSLCCISQIRLTIIQTSSSNVISFTTHHETDFSTNNECFCTYMQLLVYNCLLFFTISVVNVKSINIHYTGPLLTLYRFFVLHCCRNRNGQLVTK